ncbi:MAG: hypothetical protein AAGB48_01995 [Planctomycetota bacterium]
MTGLGALAIMALAAIAVASILALCVGRLIFRLDARGAALIGGIGAGVALGPACFGLIAPESYQRLWLGGTGLDQQAAAVDAQTELDAAAIQSAGASPEAAEEHTAAGRSEAAHLRRLAEADRRTRRLGLIALATAAGLLALLGWSGAPPSRPHARWLGLGAVAAVLAALLGAVGARFVVSASITDAALFGALLAGGSLAARRGRSLAVGVGSLTASLIVLAFAAGPPVLVAVLIVGLAWVTGVIAGERSAFKPRWPGVLADTVLAPACAALVLASVTAIPNGWGVVLIVLAVVLAGDTALLGWVLAVKWLGEGRRWWRPLTSFAIVWLRGGPAVTMILLALAAMAGGLDPATQQGAAFAYAAAASAAMTELSRPMTLRWIRTMRTMRAGVIRP